MSDFDEYYNTPRITSIDLVSTLFYGSNPPTMDTSIDLFKSSSELPTSLGDEISESSGGVFPSKGAVLYYIAAALISVFAALYIFN